jgi:hypothetical protein
VREEALEDGRKGREKKERLKAGSKSNGHHFNNANIQQTMITVDHCLLDICIVEMMLIASRTSFQPLFFLFFFCHLLVLLPALKNTSLNLKLCDNI